MKEEQPKTCEQVEGEIDEVIDELLAGPSIIGLIDVQLAMSTCCESRAIVLLDTLREHLVRQGCRSRSGAHLERFKQLVGRSPSRVSELFDQRDIFEPSKTIFGEQPSRGRA